MGIPPKIAAVVGPTATGKTRLGVELALALGGEVVSSDSMQLYRGMDVGTAKPTEEEMRGVAHHMISVAEPEEWYSVARYVREATACVDDIFSRGRLPIVVGGTGLYVDALLAGQEFAAAPDPALRAALRGRMEREGAAALLLELRALDPETAEKLPVGDEKRILRALEVWYATGQPLSAHHRARAALPPRYEAAVIGLDYEDRTILWRRVDERVDRMMADGLPEEVRALLGRGLPSTATAMQAIGYKELAAALEQGGDTAAAAAEIKLRTRQYAKRQRTWFRRRPGIFWIMRDKTFDFSDASQISTDFLRTRGVG